FIQNVRYAFRMLGKNPGFTLVAVLSLGLGIGANTAIFTLINSLMLKSLPVREPQQLVSFGKAVGGGQVDGIGAGPLDIFTYDFYKQVEQDHGPFQGICGYSSFPMIVSVRPSAVSGTTANQAISHLVSGNFFSVLGAEPIMGRAIAPSDADAPGRNPVAVISYRYWQQVFSADPAVIGRAVTINGTLFSIIGVMPEKFYGVELNEESTDMWLPITMQQEAMLQPSLLDPHGLYWMHMMGRLNEGGNVAQAQAWLTNRVQQFMIARDGGNISDARRKEIQGAYVELLPGGQGISHLREQYSQPLYILMFVVVLVLVIACANLANFLLAKTASREREISTRLALGASRFQIMQQIFTETVLLSLLGGFLGLLLAFWGTRGLIYFVSAGAKHTVLEASPDLRVLAFTFGVSLFTGLLFGIAPALRASHAGVTPALNANARTASASGGKSGRVFSKVLIASQVALSLVLLAGAGLFVRTLQNLRKQEFGFNRTNVLLVQLNTKFAGYKSEQLNSLHERVLSRIQALPGVRSAALSGVPAISMGNWNSPIFVQGYTPAPNENIASLFNRVSPGFFETMGIPVLRGRTIGSQDTETSTKVVVVNQTLADHFFPHGDAIGHQFTVADPSVPGLWQIVGVVRDAKYGNPREKAQRMVYFPVAQMTGDDRFAYWLQIRTSDDPANVAGEIRAAMAQVDPNLPLLDIRTIGEHVDLFVSNERLISQLSSFFSLLALLLACIGLYGVMTYNVVRRTNEIGIRIALGAQNKKVLWMVLKESMFLLGIGIGVGVPATLAATRLIQAQLFGLKASDPITLASAIFVIACVTLLAAFLPARRAAQVDPMVALRYE
ncbi:MAG TPA: ABC transporter permease, partial [Terriglobales bacterium]